MLLRFCFACLLSAVIGTQVFAARSLTARKNTTSSVALPILGWKSLLGQALEKNGDILSLRKQQDAANYQTLAIASDFYPAVYLFGDRTRHDQRNSLIDSKLTTDTYGVKASWNLFNGFSTYNNYRKYSLQEAEITAQTRSREADIRVNLRRAYNRALVAQRALVTWNKILQNQDDQLSVVQIKYNNGAEAQWSIELTRANVEMAKAVIEVETAHLTNARLEIEAILNQNLPPQFQLQDDLEVVLNSEIRGSLTDAHPDLALLENQVREAQTDAAIQRADYLPSLKASLQWANLKMENQETTKDNQFSLTLTFPLFEGFSTTNLTSRARAVALSREYSLNSNRLQLEKDIDKARSQLAANLRYLRAKELEVRATKLWSQTVERQYRLGVRRYSDWDQAQSKMVSSEKDYLDILSETLESRLVLERKLAVTEDL